MNDHKTTRILEDVKVNIKGYSDYRVENSFYLTVA